MSDTPTSTAVAKTEDVDANPANLPDRYREPESAEVAVAAHSNLPQPRELNALWKVAGAYSQMPGMSETYANNQPAVMAALLTAWTLDLPTTPQVVNEFYAWKAEGGRMTMYPSTSILVALGAKNGVELWFDENSDATFARAFCRRRGEQRVHSYTFTIQMAKDANLLGKPNWKAAPDVMLRYRAARRLLKSVAPDVVLGIPSNVLDADPIPVLDRKELEAAATELHVPDDDEPREFECPVADCDVAGKHQHDPSVAKKATNAAAQDPDPTPPEYAADDPERPFD